MLTLVELKVVNLHPLKAIKLGITVDYFRKNRSDESLNLNSAR
jgi:ribosomal protein L13E